MSHSPQSALRRGLRLFLIVTFCGWFASITEGLTRSIGTFAPISERTLNVATNFYGSDGLGSIRFLLTSAGTVTNTYAYDPFGDLVASTGSLTNNYRHQGEQYDPDIGRYFHRARERDQNIGRFMSQVSVIVDEDVLVCLPTGGVKPISTD